MIVCLQLCCFICSFIKLFQPFQTISTSIYYRFSLTISTKKDVGILIGIEQNLYINFGRIDINFQPLSIYICFLKFFFTVFSVNQSCSYFVKFIPKHAMVLDATTNCIFKLQFPIFHCQYMEIQLFVILSLCPVIFPNTLIVLVAFLEILQNFRNVYNHVMCQKASFTSSFYFLFLL